MIESKGKARAREVLYTDCLPAWLNESQLANGHFLVLLGDEPRELQYFDEKLKIHRSQICSVERDYSKYSSQYSQNLGVSLYYGDITEYLKTQLHTNQAYQALILDVEGSYMHQIDPAMTSVMLFCWRNPRTVVMTNTTTSRDRQMLWEGVRSLATFLSINPTATMELVATQLARYKQFKFEFPVHMVLRDMFWLRSILEHTLNASCAVGLLPVTVLTQFMSEQDKVWQSIVKAKPKPLRLEHLLGKMRPKAFQRIQHCMGIRFENFIHLLYRAEAHWTQSCYFVNFQTFGELLTLSNWLEISANSFVATPLVYVDKEGKRKDVITQESVDLPDDLIIWQDPDIYTKYKPRKLKPVAAVPHLMQTVRYIRDLTKHNGNGKQHPKHKNGTADIARLVENGVLTDRGREVLRQLASDGWRVEDIRNQLPNDVPDSVIRAYVAAATRKERKRPNE